MPLLDFPPDVLWAIFQFLCPHCHDESSRIWTPWHAVTHDAQLVETIKSLTLTCKYISRVAQPILHHRFVYEPLSTCFRLYTRLFLLLRTLHVRSDLRRHVARLDIEVNYRPCYCCPRTESPEATDDQVHLAQKLCEEAGVELDTGTLRGHQWEEALMQLLLVMLPNLSELHLAMPRDWALVAIRERQSKDVVYNANTGHLVAIGGGAAWPFLGGLRHLQLRVEDFNLDGCVRDHGDCNRPCSERPAHRILIAAAPNLRKLSCTDYGVLGMPPLRSLTHLEMLMTGVWPEGSLKEALSRSRLPAMTHFCYTSVNEHAPTPREMQAALGSSHGDQLEYLSMCVEKLIGCLDGFQDHDPPWEPGDRWAPPQDPGFVLGPFAAHKFPKLRTLVVDDYMIWPDATGHPTTHRHGYMPERDLTQFLPPFLEVLFIDDCTTLAMPLSSLAHSIQAGRMHSLKRIIWFDTGGGGYHVIDARRKDHPGWIRDDLWKVKVSSIKDHRVATARLEAFPDWSWELESKEKQHGT